MVFFIEKAQICDEEDLFLGEDVGILL